MMVSRANRRRCEAQERVRHWNEGGRLDNWLRRLLAEWHIGVGMTAWAGTAWSSDHNAMAIVMRCLQSPRWTTKPVETIIFSYHRPGERLVGSWTCSIDGDYTGEASSMTLAFWRAAIPLLCAGLDESDA